MRTAIRMLRVVAGVGCGVMLASGSLAGQDLWLMKGHDARRTGQSRSVGPRVLDPDRSWTAEAPAGVEINIGPTVTRQGVFFGTWGILRTDPLGRDERFWDKSDGKLYGLDLDTGASLWGGPLDLDLVARCYDYPGRERIAQDDTFCRDTPYHVTFYNGTVEGQAAADTARGTLYVGRGDGRLFAVDPEAGRVRWRFETFNPRVPDDPDGGGEIVSAPLLGPDGTVYFGTWGEGPYETHAFYAVNPDSTLQWRFPADSSLTHRIFASPALSPDGETIYVGTFLGEGDAPGTLYAFHRSPLGAAPDEARLKWALPLVHDGRPVYTATLAVGTDGTVYVGAVEPRGLVNEPVVFAVRDTPGGPTFAWDPAYHVLDDGAHYVIGLALREIDGASVRLYAATANVSIPIFNAATAGALHALDLATGAALASYDPSDDVPEAVGSLNSPALDADGVLYVGVRGRAGGNGIPGQVFALTYDPAEARFDRLWNAPVGGHLEWSHPALGPDGGVYVGDAVGAGTGLPFTFPVGFVPPGTTPSFYAFKGEPRAVAVDRDSPVFGAARLEAAYPNPFRDRVTLHVRTARPGLVRLDVFDTSGRRVRTLADAVRAAGRHVVEWDGRDASGRPATAGVYFVRLRVTENGAQLPVTGLRAVTLLGAQ